MWAWWSFHFCSRVRVSICVHDMVFVYIYVLFIWVYAFTYSCMRTHSPICKYTRFVSLCFYGSIHVHPHACIYVKVHVRIHGRTQVLTHIYVRMHMYMHMSALTLLYYDSCSANDLCTPEKLPWTLLFYVREGAKFCVSCGFIPMSTHLVDPCESSRSQFLRLWKVFGRFGYCCLNGFTCITQLIRGCNCTFEEPNTSTLRQIWWKKTIIRASSPTACWDKKATHTRFSQCGSP